MSRISAKPPKLDLEIVRGDDFGPVLCEIRNPDGTPMDLTGCTFSGHVRNQVNASTILASFIFVIVDAALGKYSFELTAAATALIPGGPATPQDPSAGKHVYDHQMTDSLGRVTTRRQGALIVVGDVTRV